ncbi:hypothetical protein CTI12_AA170880 [Artemisia annua]|uniref:Uncharacterized protein n=1 Tax=Artemisia annua TaxID=35608 RepID=A0A2U1PBS2_ARTAN|nr:hypothetical protein CTI12_AA170880 [Artemisia annua]
MSELIVAGMLQKSWPKKRCWYPGVSLLVSYASVGLFIELCSGLKNLSIRLNIFNWYRHVSLLHKEATSGILQMERISRGCTYFILFTAISVTCALIVQWPWLGY